MRFSLIALVAFGAGCPSPPATSKAPQSTAPAEQADDLITAEPGDAVATQEPNQQAIDAISETEARAILADAFRRAGYRILYDEPPAASSIALDGYDPRHAVGYEYIAVAEQASATNVRELASDKVLVIGPASRDAVIEASTKFVDALVAAQK